jgi:ABC-2 type transport system permease protein
MSIDSRTRSVLTLNRFPALVPAGLVARRAVRGAAVWGAVFGVMTWSIVNEFATQYPTAADRARLVATMASDVGSRAIFGMPRQLDTVAGYEAYHVIAVFGIIGAVWGLLAGTRLLRGEEDAGRWEPLLAGQTTRRRATVAGLAGLGVGLFTFWAVSAAAIVAIGRTADPPFTVTASLFTAIVVVAAAGVFLAVGALCSQLAANRRQAAGWSAAVFGVVYLLRLIAYSGTSLRWLRWASPLGWIDELRPLTGSRPLLLMPILATITVLVAVTIVLAGRRDLGAGVLPAHDTAAPRTRFLNEPLGLAWRLNRRTTLGWVAGLALGGFVFGISTKSAETVWENSGGGVIQKLGGSNGGASYLGIVFLLIALCVGIAAAGQIAATREEEAEGYLDHLLARPVARLRWLASRFALSAVILTGLGVVGGLSAWIGAVSTGAQLSLPTLLAAGVNVVPTGVLVLGIGTLVHAAAPRLAVGVAYGVVAWSFLIEIVGASLGASRWLLDLSLLHHIARAPAESVRWDSAAILVVLGIVFAVIGAAVFARRDLAGA